jgi:EAL domain-containing protein (putative c-di-GMP-specific phosphodiesterase class I)
MTEQGEAPIGAFDARLRRLDDVEQAKRGHAGLRLLEREMRLGLAADQFRLFYQPIVTLPAREIVAVEALLRWEHPIRGLVSPLEFIPVAEQSMLIVQLGAWVVNEACRQVRLWQETVPGLASLRVSVNVSSHQLTRDLIDIVELALTSSGLAPECLELEITESVVMADIDDALAILDALGSLGVSISVDDFGTGFSSLAYLKRLPVTGLKIDKSFIDDFPADARDVSIVSAVIALASALGLSQTAEGVETEAQRRALDALGCTHAQGYLFSRPQPPERLLENIESLLVHRTPPVIAAQKPLCSPSGRTDESGIARLIQGGLGSSIVPVLPVAPYLGASRSAHHLSQRPFPSRNARAS